VSAPPPESVATGIGAAAAEAAARPLWGEVDLAAITHNVAHIRKRAGRPVRLLVPVKANAYGHGVEAVGRHLERLGVEGVATANVDEAVALRRAGVALRILMYGSQLPEGAAYLFAHGLTPTVYDRPGLAAVAGAATGGPVAVHVKVDGGFGRLGVRLDEAADLVRAVAAEPRVHLEGLYTHVPFDDVGQADWARRRLAAFAALVRDVEAEHRIEIAFAEAAASSALALDLPDDLNTLAPGHLVYGLCPVAGLRAEDLGFRPALRALRARLIHVGRHRPGDDVPGAAGPPAARTGVVLIGADNGYGSPTGAAMLCHGVRCPVLSVTTEYTVIDLSAVDAVVGDEVTIIGAQGEDRITVDEVATATGAAGPGVWTMGLRNVPLRHEGAAGSSHP